jgi:hypothetical protein
MHMLHRTVCAVFIICIFLFAGFMPVRQDIEILSFVCMVLYTYLHVQVIVLSVTSFSFLENF